MVGLQSWWPGLGEGERRKRAVSVRLSPCQGQRGPDQSVGQAGRRNWPQKAYSEKLVKLGTRAWQQGGYLARWWDRGRTFRDCTQEKTMVRLSISHLLWRTTQSMLFGSWCNHDGMGILKKKGEPGFILSIPLACRVLPGLCFPAHTWVFLPGS